MELSEAPVMEEVKRGFKKTDVGMIPDNWEVKKILEFASMRTGPFGTALHKSDYTTNGIPIVNPMHIVDGHILPNQSMTVTEAAATQLSPFKLKSGDIIMGRRGDMGRCAVVSQNQEGWLCGTGSLIIRCNESVDNYFIQRVLSSPRIISAMIESSVGSTMVNLNQGTMGQLNVQFPPLSEQRAIATALSEVDALLGSLDALIAKKKAIKQGAMQQLLIGKQRLPGFKGEWEVKRLGDVFRIFTGQSKSRFIREGGRFLIADMGSITTEGKLNCSKQTDYNGDFLKRGDLVMPKDDIGGGKIIGKAAFIDKNNSYILGDHVYLLEAQQGEPLFLSYVINAWATNSALRKQVGGSAQLSLGRKSVVEQEIPYPNQQEQTAIATVLSDMDAELEALAARRAKTALLKQGMMQELLTGRTRLI